MPTSWTHYWTRECVAAMQAEEGRRLNLSTGNLFTKRGVKKGDEVFILSATQETLYLIGRITVTVVMPYLTYVQKFQSKSLWRNDEVIVGSGTPCCLKRPIPEYVQDKLSFENQRGVSPFIRGSTRMDAQGFRGLHVLTPESANLLNSFMRAAAQDPDLLHDD